MKFFLFATLLLLSLAALAQDSRLAPPKDLNGYFPFEPPLKAADWPARRDFVRRQILVSQGLWPMPAKTPLNAVRHGKIDCGEYTVEKVYFESAPGFFVTGNLYRPKNVTGKVPGVLFAHGHWTDARIALNTPEKVLQEIASGGERFEKGGSSIFQALCVQLARMGCVVWQWDMLGESDAQQLPRALVHSFAKQRPEMNTTQNWGLFSPQAEAHCQSIMGLQTWNAVRGLDFLLSLPEVDSERVAITGASGGGTQTMLLAAIDDRIKLSFPVVMVSTAMQGGCTCENASLLRVNSGNVEFAALFAPKPQGMNTANDWTKEMADKGFPELQKLYATLGAKGNVFLQRGEHFPHNYNAVTRGAFYTFLNKHFKLGLPLPVIERDYEPLSRAQLSVWDEAHPAPAGGPDFERKLLHWFTDDAEKQLRGEALNGDLKTVREGVEAIIGRNLAQAGEVTWAPRDKQDRGAYFETDGTIVNKTYRETIAARWLLPKAWNKRVVLWLDDAGKGALQSGNALNGNILNKAVQKLLQSGTAVLGVDLFLQGGDPVKQTATVKNPREFAGYTHGYNHTLFAQRTHDVLSVVALLRGDALNADLKPQRVALAAWGSAGPIALAARALAGSAIERAAIATGGFRFGQLLDYRDPMFLPGGAKYLDVPGLIALNAPHALWLAGEGAKPQAFGAQFSDLTVFSGDAKDKQSAAALWLLK